MIKLRNSKLTDKQVSKLVEKNSFEDIFEDKTLKRLNSLLSRKDLIDLNNDKMDALRLLAYHLESNSEMSSASLVKFLKS